MKFFAFLAVLAGTASVNATFEMLLVADAGNGTGGTSRVHRIDGTTGAYLGSFGGGFLNGARGIDIDQSTGRAYVHEVSGGIQVFNYNTGVYFGRLDTSTFFDRYGVFSNGSVYMTGGGLEITNVATGARNTLSTPNGELVVWVAKHSATELIVKTGTTQAMLYRFNTATQTFKESSSAFNDGSTGFFADAEFLPSVGSPSSRSIFAGLSLSGDIREYQLDAVGNFLSASSIASSYLERCFGVAKGHAGFFTCGQLATDATKGGITYFDNFRTERQGYTYSNMYAPRGMASVIAPEPGSMMVLGLGVLACLCKRRKP